MSSNIPLDIQIEIIKHLPAKSLIRFRSVSKQWKSVIHSSEFITTHHHSVNLHHMLIRYKIIEAMYVSVVDDVSFPQHQKFSPTAPPTVKPASTSLMFDCSHGLVYLDGYVDRLCMDEKEIIVIWNPSIRKSVGITLSISDAIGIGVCPKTSDVKIVKITYDKWQVDVFTLSSRAWRSLSWNLPYKSLKFSYPHAIIDGVLHWRAYDSVTKKYMIISFNLTSEEFGQIDLPDSLADSRSVFNPHIFKLNESLAVLHYTEDDAGKHVCDVWKMLKNGVPKSPFTKLYTVTLQLEDGKIIGFLKNGQPIVDQLYIRGGLFVRELEVYDPYSKHISGLGIYGSALSMASYTESLLLLNYPDSIVLS
ncbi:putative F-box protein At1g47790 [Bidens hawaiensis]|uniref:putative F-box protein At1g47790 n=1 Tax=Bidens hawaiensis TaxID=980011 RepID=UPI00404B27F8